MRRAITKRRIVMLSSGVIMAGLLIVLNFSDVCRLEAVTVDGQPLENWEVGFGLQSGNLLLNQPVDDLAEALLAKDGIVRVDIEYHLPDQISVRTNRFEPVCLVLDDRTGVMRGLTAKARIVTLQPGSVDWDDPILVGLRADRLYDICDDHRVRSVIVQLAELRTEYPDLYRLIDEIDFVSPECLTVSIEGLPYRLRVSAGELARQLDSFVRFLEQFHPVLDSTRALDMRFDDMIVEEKGANSRG